MTKNPKVTIGLILFKGEEYLSYSLRSLVDQDYPNIEFLFRDQSPSGEAYDYIQKELPDVFKKIQIEKGDNLWHSGGHNVLIGKMTGVYYFCCSNDMLYPKDFVSRIVSEMEKPEHQIYGSATCKLMRWDFEKARTGDMDGSRTDFIDSFGIAITKGHQFFDIGQGQQDPSPYEGLKQVFGPSGALAVYRKKALDDISYINHKDQKEYFDELLHYKNDVDLAYRLQWAGYSCLFIPEVTVYHDRQVGQTGNSPLSRLAGQSKKSAWARGNSLFGHLVSIRKNMSSHFSLSIRLKTAFYLFLRYIHTTLLDAQLLDQYNQIKKFEREINTKRRVMLRRRPAKEIEEMMV